MKMTFDEWFEQNKEELAPLLRGDEEEALYRAWFAGYEAGLAEMSKFARELWTELK
jgi:hypothetical protein